MFEVNVSLVINTIIPDYNELKGMINRVADKDHSVVIEEYLTFLKEFTESLDIYKDDKRKNASIKDIAYINEQLHTFSAYAYEYSLCEGLSDKERVMLFRVIAKVSERTNAAISVFLKWGLKDD